MLEHKLPVSRTATWAAVAELTPMKLEMTCPLVAVAVTTCNSIAGNEPQGLEDRAADSTYVKCFGAGNGHYVCYVSEAS